jgi:site-specific DNA-methyltransferase (adenine-specific)/modification methylase
MELNKIYNESNIETLKKLDEKSIDVVLTSPFYNTNKKAGKSRTLQNTTVKEGEYNYVRYDVFVDNMTNDEYTNYTIDLFNGFDRVLKENGVVLYNISYGADNAFGMFDTVTQIVKNTKFSIADCITWKKKNALPNSVSSNKLTRIVEFVFVFCRKDEYKTFHANKNVVSIRQNGQPQYSVYYNFIEAKNNDENCPFNKATYSTELCKKLLTMYCARGGVVYDPFMGSGTTAVACKEMGLKYIGSEISENQCKWAEERLKKTFDESEFELDFENAI